MTSLSKDGKEGDVAAAVAAPGLEFVDWGKSSTILKKFTFSQVTPLISTGSVRRLEPEDLCHFTQLESEALSKTFVQDWHEEKEKNPTKPNLIKTVLKRHKFIFVWTGFLYLIAQASIFVGPLMLRKIVRVSVLSRKKDTVFI